MSLDKEKLRALFPRAPIESDGFTKSFSCTQEDEIKEFLSQYGFCVVKVIEDELCDRAVNEMFEFANKTKNPRRICKLERDNPATWGDENWPGSGKFLFDDPGHTQSSYDIRTHKNVYKVFRAIFNGETRFYCGVDAWGVMRGNKDILLDGEYQQKPTWKWELDPHWDVDPWNHVEDLKHNIAPQMYQGLVALEDCPEEVGGFCTVPGCTPYMQEWVKNHQVPKGWSRKVPLKQFHPPQSEPLLSRMQRIPIRKGEMIIWNSLQLHSNFSNQSEKMRIVQYLRYCPATSEAVARDGRCSLRAFDHYPSFKSDIEKGLIKVNRLGRRLLSIEPYPKDSKKCLADVEEDLL